MSSKVKIFAASASKKLALSIAENFGQPLGDTSIVYFSDGEFEPLLTKQLEVAMFL